MIETEIIYKETTKEIAYPCLMKHIYSPLIVLMTARKCGRVISDNRVHDDNGGYSVGQSSTDWSPNTFNVFKGRVVLENKSSAVEEEEEKEIVYPCCLEDKHTGAVVGFTSYRKGTVIKSGGQSKLGTSSDRWNMSYFTSSPGKYQESEKQVYPVIMIDPKDGEVCLLPKENDVILLRVVDHVSPGLTINVALDGFEQLKGKLMLENYKGSILATTEMDSHRPTHN